MEPNEDQPLDVVNATPVEEEIRKAETNEQLPQLSTQSNSRQIQAEKSRNITRSNKSNRKEENCAKKMRKKGKGVARSTTMTVFVNEKECILPRINPIPRHCLSKNEWIDVLATPSRKCPPPCRKKQVERKLRPVSARINELALPTRQRMMMTLQDCGEILPAELVDKLINILEGESCLSPEQAERLFRRKIPSPKKSRKNQKSKCKTSTQTSKKPEPGHTSFNKDAMICQQLMTKAFIKNLLQWKCSLPKDDFKDIANIIIKRLSTTLEYNLVDNADRSTQQIKLLADTIAAWIVGILLEVAEAHKEDLEKECEERKRMEEEEETEDETEESEEEQEYNLTKGDPKSLLTVDQKESKKGKEKGDTESENEQVGDDTPKHDKRRDQDDDDGGGRGGDGVPDSAADSPEAPEDHGEPPISDEPSGDGPEPSPDENVQQESSPDELQLGKDSESSPDVELQDVTKPLSHDAEEQRDSKPPTDGIEQRESSARQVPEDNIDTSASQRAAGIDPKPEDGEATVDSPSKEAPVAGIPSTDSQEQDKSEIPPTIPPVKPSSSAEERLEGQAVPAEASAIKLEIDEKESEKKIVVESSTASAVPENPDVSRDLQSTPAVAGEEISPEEIATDEPAIKQESASQMRDQELLKAGILPSKYVSSSPSPGLKGKRGENEGKDLDFLEGNLRKMLQTDVPFLDLLRIFDTIENAVAKEKENQGEDLITDRIHRAIYEKLERLVKAETPERLTAHLRDVLDVLSGKIAQWVRNILTDSEMIFLNENPPMVESGELRNFGEWIVEMSERANSWTVWMQNMITELMKMQPNQVTRADWQNWTRNFAEDALKWRRYYLESVHYAHHNRAMLAGREVVKTGEIKYSKWSIQEKVIETTDFLTD